MPTAARAMYNVLEEPELSLLDGAFETVGFVEVPDVAAGEAVADGAGVGGSATIFSATTRRL